MASIALGRASCQLLRPVLRRHEVAFVAQLTEKDVRNLFRRGERLQERGVSVDDIVRLGALPVSMAGSARGASPAAVAAHPRVADSPLALAMLRALVSGRLRAPRAEAPDQLPAAPDREMLLTSDRGNSPP